MTTVNDSRNILYSHFITEWSDTTLFGFENERFDPPSDAPWVRMSVRNTDAGQETMGSIGSRKYIRRGTIYVQLFTLTDAGTSESGLLSEQIRDIFEGKRIDVIVVNNGIIHEPGIDGKWFYTLIEIPFEFSITK